MIKLEVWLYGSLARYAGDQSQGSYAQLQMEVPEGTTVGELLARLGVPAEERGITFINGQLSSMPGLATDLGQELQDGDRIGLFSPKSMWPFQYRFGARVGAGLQEAFRERGDRGVRHAYTTSPQGQDSQTQT